MIESIEKLREFVDDQFVISGQAYLQGMAIAESIEREIAERYMLLPVDADGVPIRCGDTVSGGMGDSGKVQHVEIWPDVFVVVYERQPGQFARYSNDAVHHVKPRTIEDVLDELADEIIRQGHQAGLTAPGIIAKYADELRGMGVDNG